MIIHSLNEEECSIVINHGNIASLSITSSNSSSYKGNVFTVEK